jgi:hypothetical protein
MSARRFLLVSTLSLGTLGAIAGPILRAEDLNSAPDVEVGRHQFIGEVNTNDVFVRSGPREDAYPTMKLDKGAKVTVVGMKFNYLKILPPDGSFAFVPQVYVDRRGDGSVGRANREIVAKVGSDLNDMKIAAMSKVNEGDDVTILGSEDEYFKIKPPEGSYLYVDKSFVDPVQVVPEPGQAPVPVSPGVPTPPVTPTVPDSGQLPIVDNTQGPTTRNSSQVAVALPTTKPSADTVAASTKFDKLEADFTAANDKAITDQPLADLTAGYTAFEQDPGATATQKKIADVRLSTLKLRSEARDEFVAVKEAQAKMQERQKSLQAASSKMT